MNIRRHKKFFRHEKYVEVSLDYCGTGIWSWLDGRHWSIPLEWLPISRKTRAIITIIQRDFDSGKFDDDMNYIFEPHIDSDFETRLTLARELVKRELPDWSVEG